MKKFVKYLLVVCLIVPFAFMLTGCNEPSPANIMTLSVNPEVSFVLDSNNKVISVKFEDGQNGNCDAGTIYADVNFVGKDLDATIQLFIERAAISGHIDLNGDEVIIDIKGQSDVTELQNKAKAKVEEMFNKLGVTVTTTISQATAEAKKQALVETAKLLAPEMTDEAIEAMSNDELVKLISEKQQEYKDLAYSQIETVKNTLEESFQTLLNTAKQQLEQAEELYKKAEQDLENAKKLAQTTPNMEDAISKAQIALTAARNALDNAKTLLEQQAINFNTAKDLAIQQAKMQAETIKQQLVANFKTQVENTQQTLLNHLQTAKDSNKITQEQYEYWVNIINSQIQA